jgi:hypothetical protein
MSLVTHREIQHGILILLQELVNQLMLKLHHIQVMLSIYKLLQLKIHVLTQTKLLKLMNHATLQETQPGIHILLLELESQLMPRPHHTQDMPFIYRLPQLKIHVLTQTKQLRQMNHAILREILLGTLIPPLELESQLMLRLHHTQDMLFIYRFLQLKIPA